MPTRLPCYNISLNTCPVEKSTFSSLIVIFVMRFPFFKIALIGKVFGMRIANPNIIDLFKKERVSARLYAESADLGTGRLGNQASLDP